MVFNGTTWDYESFLKKSQEFLCSDSIKIMEILGENYKQQSLVDKGLSAFYLGFFELRIWKI